jgi:large subunit ribosomal protein L4
MKSVSVLDIKGKVAGKISLDQSYFNGKINKPLLQQAVLMYLANRRCGCASTKTRDEVRGGGRKPWRQKGTGRARTGSIRNPIWRGGGVVFGPHPRKYGYSPPKNIKSLALQHSLNSKIKDNELVVVDKISLASPKAKEFILFLTAIKAKDRPLVVIEKHSPDILRGSRNIPGVTVKPFNNINAHDVLRHKKVVFSKQALENLVKLRKI